MLWLVLAVLYVLTAGYASLSTDVIATYLPAWSLGQHHTANLDGFQQMTLWLHEVDGHLRSDRFPGAILLAVPAYWLFGDPSGPEIWPSALTAGLAAATSVALMHRTLLRIAAPGLALAGALVLALGTATWSVSADALWTHTATQLGLCLALYGMASRRPWFGAIGMTLSAAARPHTAVVAAVLGVGDAIRTRKIWTAAWLAAGSLAGFAVVLVWSGQTLGHASLLPGTYAGRGGEAATAASQHGYGWPLNVAGYLFSPERGLLVLCPFMVVCLFGLRRAWRRMPGWVKDAGYAAVAYSILQLAVNNFAGGWGFYSFRLGIETITLLTPMLVLGAREVVRDRRLAWLLAVLVTYSVAVHTLGATWYQNVNEGPVWWTRYQPAEMAIDQPWRPVVAVLVAVAVTAALAMLVRSDDADQDEPDVSSSSVSSAA